MHFHRRRLLASLAAFTCPGVNQLLRGQGASIPSGMGRRILLRSSWQTVNIGDVAHTPGVLAILEREWPEAEVWLWPSKLSDGVREMLRVRFPRLRFAETEAARKEALAVCDFFLHGSGPSLVGEKSLPDWLATGKPWGVWGITLNPALEAGNVAADGQNRLREPDAGYAATLRLLGSAKFVFFRDSKSLELAQQWGCKCPVMKFGPDGAFATDVTDVGAAEAFLREAGLVPGKFLCCIPRLRFTPYWTIPEKKAAFHAGKHARNEELKEQDHLPHRLAIQAVLAETDLKVLLCPEDETQMAVGKENILDRLELDAESKKRVVWRRQFWPVQEALAVYRQSAGLFGNEMHSPIMCVGNGVPAMVCRWREQTTKGYMWKDIGLGQWLFDFDKAEDRDRFPGQVLAMAKDAVGARQMAEKGRAVVLRHQREMVATLRGAF